MGTSALHEALQLAARHVKPPPPWALKTYRIKGDTLQATLYRTWIYGDGARHRGKTRHLEVRVPFSRSIYEFGLVATDEDVAMAQLANHLREEYHNLCSRAERKRRREVLARLKTRHRKHAKSVQRKTKLAPTKGLKLSA